MSSIFNILLVNMLILPVMVYRNFQLSEDIFGNESINNFLPLSAKLRKILFLNAYLPLNWIGLTFHILVSIVSFVITIVLALLSIVKITIILFDFKMIWFSSEILIIIGLFTIGYSFIFLLVFSFISWIKKKL